MPSSGYRLAVRSILERRRSGGLTPAEADAEWLANQARFRVVLVPAWLATRRDACAACELRTVCGLWAISTCRGHALLGTPTICCPGGPPRWGPVCKTTIAPA
jgi:hypothetical protein